MRRLLPLLLSLSTLMLAGCGEESDELPTDGRDFDGVGYGEPQPYTGRVIDGYLSNARVWLDMDGNSQYTPGPLTITLPSGTEVVLPGGEPTAMSGENGEFQLDISELVRDPEEAPDLDPRDYPLFALALPGQTTEATHSGEVVVEKAFMLSAPPGVRNVTPLSTLVRQRRIVGAQSLVTGRSELASALANVNLVSDYVRSGDHRAHAYARAFARFLASQFPPEYNAILANGDGTEYYLSREAAYLLGVSFVRNALEVVRIVDEAASGGSYQNVNAAELALPEVPLELSDPVVITHQVVQAYPESGSLPATLSQLQTSAELGFDYTADGQLTQVEVNGCIVPSLPELARLINAGGKIVNTDIQWLPSISLSEKSHALYSDGREGPDERLVFDWNNRKAYFETTATCQSGLAAGTELGGEPSITYEWSMSGGELAELKASYDFEDGTVVRTLTPDYGNATDVFPGYSIEESGAVWEAIDLTSGRQSCSDAIDPDDEDASAVVSARQAYDFLGHSPQPTGFESLALEFDLRNNWNRLLRFGFLSPELSDSGYVTDEPAYEWTFYYSSVGSNQYEEDYPNLIASAYLKPYAGARDCGREFESPPSGAFARVNYSYQRLSEYLTELVE